MDDLQVHCVDDVDCLPLWTCTGNIAHEFSCDTNTNNCVPGDIYPCPYDGFCVNDQCVTNLAPTIVEPPSITIDAGTLYQRIIVAGDPEGEDLAFVFTGKGQVQDLGTKPESYSLTWQTTSADVGIHHFVFGVGTLDHYVEVQWAVNVVLPLGSVTGTSPPGTAGTAGCA